MSVNKLDLKYYLNESYPFYYDAKKVFKIVFVLFIVIFLFFYLLHPYNDSYKEHRLNFFWISFLHSLIPVLVILFFSFLLKNSKTATTWTIRKETVFTLSVLFFSGILQFLIRDILYNNPLNWSWGYLFLELKKALVAGTFIRLIIIPLNLNRFQNKEIVPLITTEIPEKKEIRSVMIVIETDVKSEKFSFNSNDFIYAKSEGNYVEIYIKKEDAIIKLTKRLAIKNLEERLKEFPFITKTHRSILLNLNAIEKVSGNALGYQVKLNNCSETVPVSRKFIPSFNAKTISK
jgi:hypothetical protein